MVKYYIKTGAEKMREIETAEKGCWIYLESPTKDEIARTAEKTGIPAHFIAGATDEEEQARIESEDGNLLVLIDIPKGVDREGKRHIETIPMGIIMNDSYFVTVCVRRTSVLDDFLKQKFGAFDTSKQRKLLYHVLYNVFTRFLFYLRTIDKAGNDIQKNIAKTMKNDELLELVDLQKSLVFFSASLSANHAVVQKIINGSASKNTPDEKELLDDVLIETRQAIEMCAIYREIIKNSMDAFSSIANNNMNLIMKFLTAITIVLSIPMIIAGYWGMNTGVPWESKMYGFWIAVGISVVLSVVTLIYFIRKKML